MTRVIDTRDVENVNKNTDTKTFLKEKMNDPTKFNGTWIMKASENQDEVGIMLFWGLVFKLML